MSKAKRLTEYEKGKIVGLKLNNLSIREIAKIIKRSKTVIHNYLKLKDNYGKKGRQGRKKILSKRVQSHIARLCSNQITSARKIKSELGLIASVRTIQRTISTNSHFKYEKMQTKPQLK